MATRNNHTAMQSMRRTRHVRRKRETHIHRTSGRSPRGPERRPSARRTRHQHPRDQMRDSRTAPEAAAPALLLAATDPGALAPSPGPTAPPLLMASAGPGEAWTTGLEGGSPGRPSWSRTPSEERTSDGSVAHTACLVRPPGPAAARTSTAIAAGLSWRGVEEREPQLVLYVRY